MHLLFKMTKFHCSGIQMFTLTCLLQFSSEFPVNTLEYGSSVNE